MPSTYRLLICDDDAILRDTLTEQLDLCEEFTVFTEANAADAIQRVASERIDLAVMDVGLPDLDGREAVRRMRAGGFRGPVIMLTAQDSEADHVEGLEAGANDYVTKPFKF
ncbi:MAG: response regulator, partial [Parafilimonas terrae]|nr:response regulator [Parafilimonas terrae]